MSYPKIMNDQNSGEKVLYSEVSFFSRHFRRLEYGLIEELLSLETSLAFTRTFAAFY